ncbi:MAG: metallophosphoesterase family protein [Phycisphaeraceae bacterium]|nr:metallophosphoesterase family protein [Phycisphaeraceae bacterium]
MTVRVLVAGDIHIGRVSSRVPGSAGASVAERMRAVEGWHAVVDAARAQRVRVCVLTGDIADESNRAWEAIGPLRDGIQALAASGIDTVAIAGNHDFEALPRLAGLLHDQPRFHLLGAGGTWTRWSLRDGDGRALVHFDGWSFPGRHVSTDPVETYTPPPGDGVPVFGVVHGDLDVPASMYAPLTGARLRSAPVDAWLLGHVHRPQVIDLAPARWAVYPGSPQALDSGEPGTHGAWLVEVDAGRIGRPRQVALSTIRYEDLDADLTGAADADEVTARLYAAIRDLEQRAIADGGDRLSALTVRLWLTGRAACTVAVDALREDLARYEGSGALAVRIDDVVSRLRPSLDLEETARGGSPLAIAARLLRDLEAGPAPAEIEALLQELRREAGQIRGGRDRVDADPTGAPDGDALTALLRDRLQVILEALHDQEPAA